MAKSKNVIIEGGEGQFLINIDSTILSGVSYLSLDNLDKKSNFYDTGFKKNTFIKISYGDLYIYDHLDSVPIQSSLNLNIRDQILLSISPEGLSVFRNQLAINNQPYYVKNGDLRLKILYGRLDGEQANLPIFESTETEITILPNYVEWKLHDSISYINDTVAMYNGFTLNNYGSLLFTKEAPNEDQTIGIAYSKNTMLSGETGEFLINSNAEMRSVGASFFSLTSDPKNNRFFKDLENRSFYADQSVFVLRNDSLLIYTAGSIADSMELDTIISNFTVNDQLNLVKDSLGIHVFKNETQINISPYPFPSGDLNLKLVYFSGDNGPILIPRPMTDVSIPAARFEDVCFTLDTEQCTNLIYDHPNIVIQTPIIVEGSEIPAGLELCIGFDKDLVPSNIPIFYEISGPNNLELNNDYTIVANNPGELCLKFEANVDLSNFSSGNIGALELIVDNDNVGTSAMNLAPFSISFPCEASCEDCGDYGVKQRALFVGLGEVPNSNYNFYSDGKTEYEIKYNQEGLNTETLDKLEIWLGTNNGTIHYEDLNVGDIIVHSYFDPVANELPFDNYSFELQATSESGMNFYLRGAVPEEGNLEYVGILPVSILDPVSQKICEANADWTIIYQEHDDVQNSDLILSISGDDPIIDNLEYIYSNSPLIQPFINITLPNTPPEHIGSYVLERVSISNIGIYQVSIKSKNSSDLEFEMTYDYIIECGNGPPDKEEIVIIIDDGDGPE